MLWKRRVNPAQDIPETRPRTRTRQSRSSRVIDFPIPAQVAEPKPSVATQRIVAIGGGTGLPAVLEGLCATTNGGDAVSKELITAIVTVTDDGGSSGRLRKTFGVLPPGDVRNCLAAAARADSPFRELLQHRFDVDGGALDGHPIGNLLLTALTQITGNFPAAIERLGDMIGLRASVLPSTREDVRLVAELESGRVLVGETAIVAASERIRRVGLTPHAPPLPEVLRALVNAQGIVVGPGSLYSSILPNLLVGGVASTISGVDAVRIYVANLMTEPGETDHYTLDDHLRAIREHVGYELFDYILVNTGRLEGPAVDRYAAQGAEPVAVSHDLRWAGGARVVECDLAGVCAAGKIRHDPGRLAHTIRALVSAGRIH
jgi:uncharacterized cofD-like protein